MMLLKRLFMMNWLKKLTLLMLVNLFKKRDYDGKITDVEGNISDITNLATTTTILTPVKNKILNANDLVKKADYEAKIKDIEGK